MLFQNLSLIANASYSILAAHATYTFVIYFIAHMRVRVIPCFTIFMPFVPMPHHPPHDAILILSSVTRDSKASSVGK